MSLVNPLDYLKNNTKNSSAVKRKHLFYVPDYLEQLKLIIDFCGMPTDEDLNSINCPKNPKLFIKKLDAQKQKTFESFVGIKNDVIDKDAIDLLKKMLVFNPNKRITVDEALKHPFIKGKKKYFFFNIFIIF